jgi:hypothetical protein
LLFSAEIVLVDGAAAGPSTARKQVELACHFYGLDLTVISPGSRSQNFQIVNALKSEDTLGVVITANTLSALEQHKVMKALGRGNRNSIPLLIIDIAKATAPGVLQDWSAGSIVAGSEPLNPSGHEFYFTTEVSYVTQELSGQSISFPPEQTSYLILDGSHESRRITVVRDHQRELPIFVQARVGKQSVFFQSEREGSKEVQPAKSYGQAAWFAQLAPFMMFLRYCAGERGWHTLGHYANLTIDDAWLTDPYGNLSYSGLLREMQKHNFHTTIAFIPWNFDRSQPDVVSLFRNHADRFSVSIHGNNHDHQEFYDYKDSPLADQVATIRQAIARMERFKALTGIPYDRVMVWPHEVVPPAPTLAALKEYNFLGDVNAGMTPLDSKRRDQPLYVLRGATLDSSNFLTIERYPVEAAGLRSVIAMKAFLANPILLYAHQDLFGEGIGAFDGVADYINQVQPTTAWRSLGDILERLYMIRLRADGNYDVKAFSNQVRLENSCSHAVTFFVQKEESFSPSIQSVTVDGQPYPYERFADNLAFRLTVPPGQSRWVAVAYENDLSVASIDISKHSMRVRFLREMSDVRDMTISRFAGGRAFIHFYDKKLSGIEFTGERNLRYIGTVFLTLVAVALSWRQKRGRAEKCADGLQGSKPHKRRTSNSAGWRF